MLLLFSIIFDTIAIKQKLKIFDYVKIKTKQKRINLKMNK